MIRQLLLHGLLPDGSTTYLREPRTIYRIYHELVPNEWTDVTADVITGGRSISYKRGNMSGGPTDLVSDIGTLEYWLRNDDENSVNTRSYYSPYT